MVLKYVDDPSLSWEERYKKLETHHIDETTDLFNKLNDARNKLNSLEKKFETLTLELKEHTEILLKLREDNRQREEQWKIVATSLANPG